jgi:hypothetical protein
MKLQIKFQNGDTTSAVKLEGDPIEILSNVGSWMRTAVETVLGRDDGE